MSTAEEVQQRSMLCGHPPNPAAVCLCLGAPLLCSFQPAGHTQAHTEQLAYCIVLHVLVQCMVMLQFMAMLHCTNNA